MHSWRQHNREIRLIIEYIVMINETKIKANDVRMYRGWGRGRGGKCGTDHFLMGCKSHIIYCKYCNKQQDIIVESTTINTINIQNTLYKYRKPGCRRNNSSYSFCTNEIEGMAFSTCYMLQPSQKTHLILIRFMAFNST